MQLTMEHVRRLEARGVKVGRGVSESCLIREEIRLGVTLDTSFRSFYSAANGFDEYDPASFYNIWEIGKVKRLVDVFLPHKCSFAVGDFMIDSDLIICDLADAMKPVFLLEERRMIGDNFDGFMSALTSGAFDVRG